MSQPQGTTLLRLERGRILDGVFLPSPESQTKECKVKPWVKNEVKQPKVARVELRAGGGLYRPEKPGWSASGMEK